ncbi:MAG: hypothetical protein Q8M40_00155 [Legionella sp.]|nr:hypothetical protein [Legionella sp.]
MKSNLELNASSNVENLKFQEYITKIKENAPNNELEKISSEIDKKLILSLEKLKELAHAITHNTNITGFNFRMLDGFVLLDAMKQSYGLDSFSYSCYTKEALPYIQFIKKTLERNYYAIASKESAELSKWRKRNFEGIRSSLKDVCWITLLICTKLLGLVFSHTLGMEKILNWATVNWSTREYNTKNLWFMPTFMIEHNIPSKEYGFSMEYDIHHITNPIAAQLTFINYAATNIGKILGLSLGSILAVIVAMPICFIRFVTKIRSEKQFYRNLAIEQFERFKDKNLSLIQDIITHNIAELPDLFDSLCIQFPEIKKEILLKVEAALNALCSEQQIQSFILGKIYLFSEDTEKAYSEFCKLNSGLDQINLLNPIILDDTENNFNIFYEMGNIAFNMKHCKHAKLFFDFAKEIAASAEMNDRVSDCATMLEVVNSNLSGSTYSIIKRFIESGYLSDKEIENSQEPYFDKLNKTPSIQLNECEHDFQIGFYTCP